MPKISVIVPCYNAAEFVSETISSVLNQTFADWSLVLVDDGSTDSTWEIITSYAAKDARIVTVHTDNAGMSAALNTGREHSPPCDYLFFLDNDDLLDFKCLEIMHRHLESNPDVGLLSCRCREIAANGRDLGVNKSCRWAPGFLFPHKMRDNEVETPFVSFFSVTGVGPFAMFRTSIYDQAGGWDERFWGHGDTDMFCRMALLAKAHFIPKPLYIKRDHPNQMTKHMAKMQVSYNLFREKWEAYAPRNTTEAEILQAAKHYYYHIHRPFREIKIAMVKFRAFCSSGKYSDLCESIRFFRNALKGGILERLTDRKGIVRLIETP